MYYYFLTFFIWRQKIIFLEFTKFFTFRNFSQSLKLAPNQMPKNGKNEEKIHFWTMYWYFLCHFSFGDKKIIFFKIPENFHLQKFLSNPQISLKCLKISKYEEKCTFWYFLDDDFLNFYVHLKII